MGLLNSDLGLETRKQSVTKFIAMIFLCLPTLQTSPKKLEGTNTRAYFRRTVNDKEKG